MIENNVENMRPETPGDKFSLFVVRTGLTIQDVAELLGVARSTLSNVIHGKVSLSIEMAKRWGKFTDDSTASWYNMQVAIDLWDIEQLEVAESINPYQGKS